MALQPDDKVCFCFHVSLRKIENFCKVNKPQAATQISECLSAGTGCGWCVPMIRKIHTRLCGQYKPFWRIEQTPEEQYHSAERDASDLAIDEDAYAAGRQKYLAETKRQPPPDAA